MRIDHVLTHMTKCEFDITLLIRARRLLLSGLKLGVLPHEWGKTPTQLG